MLARSSSFDGESQGRIQSSNSLLAVTVEGTDRDDARGLKGGGSSGSVIRISCPNLGDDVQRGSGGHHGWDLDCGGNSGGADGGSDCGISTLVRIVDHGMDGDCIGGSLGFIADSEKSGGKLGTDGVNDIAGALLGIGVISVLHHLVVDTDEDVGSNGEEVSGISVGVDDACGGTGEGVLDVSQSGLTVSGIEVLFSVGQRSEGIDSLRENFSVGVGTNTGEETLHGVIDVFNSGRGKTVEFRDSLIVESETATDCDGLVDQVGQS